MIETDVEQEPLDLTVLIPCYNEAAAIEQVLVEVRAVLAEWPGTWEIIVVDDASRDDTADKAAAAGARVIRRVENGGSGASRKTGILASRGRLIAMLDGDGSYDPACLPELLHHFPNYDQVNGARTSEEGTLKPLRFMAKLVLRKLGNSALNAGRTSGLVTGASPSPFPSFVSFQGQRSLLGILLRLLRAWLDGRAAWDCRGRLMVGIGRPVRRAGEMKVPEGL